MRRYRKRATMLAVALVVLSAGGCGPRVGEATSAAASTPTLSTTWEGRCGDGVCDKGEQANPDLCPQDCETGHEPPTETPLPPSSTPQAATPTSKPEAPGPEGKCGDGLCDEAEQENPALCPQDCAEAAVTVEVTPPEPTAATQPTPTDAPAGPETVMSAAGELALLGDPATVSQEAGGTGGPRQANLALILDGSGSMNEALPGTGKTKLAVAKEVMAELIPQIPAEMNGSLWIYGHRHSGDPKSESCQDIEQVSRLGPVDASAYVEKVEGVSAHGHTPIADSIQLAAKSLPTTDFNSIILISDGEETCGGEPCALAEALKAGDSAVTTHVVGYAVNRATKEQLQCIARASGGSYHDATDAAGLLQALQEALAATAVETVLRVEVLDPAGAEVDAVVQLYEAAAWQLVSDYAAWTDNLVSPGDYELVVQVQPYVHYHGLTLLEGSTTIVRIQLGAIQVLTPDGREDTLTYVFDASGNQLHVEYAGTILLVPGRYQLGVNDTLSQPIPLGAGERVEFRLGIIQVAGAFELFDSAGNRLGLSRSDSALIVPGTYTVRLADGSSIENVVVKAEQVTEVK